MNLSASFRSLRAAALSAAALALPGSAALAQQGTGDVAVIDGRSWVTDRSAAATPWSEASDFCDTLAAGGFSDWRLPTLPELESLFAGIENGVLPAAIRLEDCCAWSSTNLVDIEPEAKCELPDPAGGPDQYYWGLLFPEGIRYYSMNRFPDGVALCTRDN